MTRVLCRWTCGHPDCDRHGWALSGAAALQTLCEHYRRAHT